MYPISAELNLHLIDIAFEWSREIAPRKTMGEVDIFLQKHWWRGQLKSVAGADRLTLLKILFNDQRDKGGIIFCKIGDPVPQTIMEQLDGSAIQLIAAIIRVPREEPEAWTQEACAHSFEDIANCCDHEGMGLIRPFVWDVTISEFEFSSWIARERFERPSFWALASSGGRSTSSIAGNKAKRTSDRAIKQLVKNYIDGERKSEQSPTQVGAESRAKALGIAARDRVRTEFRNQMGLKTLSRGRPPKKIRGN